MTDVPLILRIVSAFSVVGLALYAFALISRHRTDSSLFARTDRLVNVIETTPLAQNASLVVVKVGERFHLIAHTSSSVSLLTEIEAPAVERVVAARRFARAWTFNAQSISFGSRGARAQPDGSAAAKDASAERFEKARGDG